MTKFFHIQYRPEIESGKYIVKTASGHKARIVCWDAVTQFNEPIVALVDYDGKEVAVNYTKDGRYIGNNENYLILVDKEEELSEWEKGVIDILSTEPSMKGTAARLFEFAKKYFFSVGGELQKAVAEAMDKDIKKVKEYYGQ